MKNYGVAWNHQKGGSPMNRTWFYVVGIAMIAAIGMALGEMQSLTALSLIHI